MEMRHLFAGIVAGCISLSATSAQSPGKTKAPDIRRAFDLALTALKDQPANWASRCGVDIRVHSEKGEWSLLFEPIGGPTSGHVLVVVKADGSTEVIPGM